MLMRILALVCAVMLAGEVHAGSKIDLVQSDGSIATQGGVSDAAKVTQATTTSCEDQTNSVCRVESQWEYEDVAASQTDQVIGGTGAVGDLVAGVYCAMSAASVGTVSIKDGSGSAFVLFQAQGAATVVSTPALNWVSTSGAWKLTTGTNTTCRVSGRFN